MAKITLTEPLSGYNLAAINANFVAIEAEFQDKVLYRDNPVGEANSLETDIDVNSKRIYNLPVPTLPSEAARLQDVQNATLGLSAANLISNVPAGTIAATNVQAALNELDTEKVSLTALALASGSTLVGTIAIGTGAVSSTTATELNRIINAARYGFVAGGPAAANVTALINAASAVTAGGFPGVVWMDHGVYALNSTFTYNPMLLQFRGDGGVTLDFSSMVTGTAIKLQSVGTAGESISRNKMRYSGGFTILGASAMTLLDVTSTGGVDNAAHTFKNIVFDTGAIGLYQGSNSWQICLEDYAFTNIAVHIKEETDATAVNHGECNKYFNGLHSGTGTAYESANYNSDAHFIGTSFDCSKFINITRGAKVRISHGHFETAADSGALFTVDGDAGGFAQTSLNIKDSVLVLPGTFRSNSVFSCGQNFAVTGGGIDIDGLAIQCVAGFLLPNNKLVAGTGPVRIKNLTSGFQFPTFGLADAINEAASGGFEGVTFAQSDFAAVDAGFPPVVDATVSHTGTNSLKMTPTGTAFVGASLTKVVRPGQKAFYNLWYKLAAIAGGAFFVITAQVLDKKGNVIVLNDSIVLSGTNDWTYYSNTSLRSLVMPPGADRLYVAVQVNSGSGTGDAWVDDFSLNIID